MTKKEIRRKLRSAIPEAEYTRIQFRMVMQSTVCTIVTLAAAAMLAANLWFPILQVYGNSMSPALRGGDVILCVKTSTPDRGDIAAFYHNNKLLIKRVIGCGGDTVEIDEAGIVSVNERPLYEPYIEEPSPGQIEVALPCRIPQGHYFVMGDCRATSLDSRSELIGCIPEDRILGKVLLRIWPLNRFGLVDTKGGLFQHDS